MNPLTTSRLALRPFEDSDFEAVHAYASNTRVTRYQTWGPNSTSDTRCFIQRARGLLLEAGPRDLHLAVEETAHRRVIGGCELLPRRTEYHEYEIGYSIHPDHWGRGFGREAVTRLLYFAFEEVAAHRVFAYIDPENTASIRLAERVGLRREGHQIRDVQIDGEWRDTFVYAVLRDEFRATAESPELRR